MSYTPKTWVDGEVISAEAMNHIEQGIVNERVGPPGPQGPAGPAGASGVSMDQVNAAIQAAVLDSWEGSY